MIFLWDLNNIIEANLKQLMKFNLKKNKKNKNHYSREYLYIRYIYIWPAVKCKSNSKHNTKRKITFTVEMAIWKLYVGFWICIYGLEIRWRILGLYMCSFEILVDLWRWRHFCSFLLQVFTWHVDFFFICFVVLILRSYRWTSNAISLP